MFINLEDAMNEMNETLDVDPDSDGPSGAIFGAVVGIVALIFVAACAVVGVLVEILQKFGG
jgi:hypothetical protein